MNRTLQKTLQYGIYALLFATLFVPTIVSTSLFFPYITGKAFIFRFLVELMVLLYVGLVITDKSYLPKKGIVLYAVLAFTVVLGISTLTSENPSRSFWSNYERMEGYVTILHLLAFFLVTSSVLKIKKIWYSLFNVSLVASVLIGLRAFSDYEMNRSSGAFVETIKGIKYFFVALFGDADTVRIAGSLGNSSYLGVYSLIHIYIALFLIASLVSYKKFKEAWFRYSAYACVALFNIIVLYNTGTRGSFVGLVGGLFIAVAVPFVLILMKKINVQDKTTQLVKKVSIVSVITILALVTLLGVSKHTQFVKNSDLLNRFSSLITLDVKSVFETQGKSRVMLWGMAWQGVKERPVLGWGQDNFPFVFAKYYNPEMYDQEQWFDRTHNVFFDWLIAGGIVALLGYLVLFGALLYVLWSKTRLDTSELYDVLLKSVLTGLLTAYFIHNLFIFDNLASYIYFFLLLSFVHAMSQSVVSTDKQVHQSLIQNPSVVITLGIVAVVAFGYVSNQVVYKPYMAGRTLIQALQISQVSSKNPDIEKGKKIVELFTKALSYNTFANVEIRERLTEIAPVIVSTKSAELIREYTGLVAKEYDKAYKEAPKDPRPRIFLGLYLQKFGLYLESLPHIEKAIELSPKKQSFMFQKGIVELSLGRYAEATQTLKTAYELEPKNDEAAVLYALSYMYNNKFDEADKILGDNTARLTDQRVLNMYLEKNMYKRIEDVIALQIRQNPNNPQTYLSLAGLYMKMNRRNDAIAQIQKAIELEPRFKTQGDFFIKEIREGRDLSRQ